jgi:hypothetical protein
MKILRFFRFYLLLLGLLFVVSALLELGLGRGVLLFLGTTFLSPSLFRAYVWARGVRPGDTVLVTLPERGDLDPFLPKVGARALGSGRRGDVIEVELNGKRVFGEVLNYGGILFPPEVDLLYIPERDITAEVRW